MTANDTSPGPRGKVVRLLEKYDIEEYGDELVARWTSQDRDDRKSLRELAQDMNVELLSIRLAETTGGSVSGEAENLYNLLTGDDVSSGERTKAERRLEKRDIDVEELRDDFVSRQAIETYFKTRGVSRPEQQERVSISGVESTIDKLRQRMKQVTASKIERLRKAGVLTIGSFRVIVDVQVYCDDCGEQYSIGELLKAQSCNCNT